jgi:hypothetical protein
MYHPLLVFDGQTGQLLTAVLRPGNAHASHQALRILKRIVARLRAAWPEVEIAIRADAGFAILAIYDYLEEEGIEYTIIGLATNSRLQELWRPHCSSKQKSKYPKPTSKSSSSMKSSSERRCGW